MLCWRSPSGRPPNQRRWITGASLAPRTRGCWSNTCTLVGRDGDTSPLLWAKSGYIVAQNWRGFSRFSSAHEFPDEGERGMKPEVDGMVHSIRDRCYEELDLVR